MKGVFMKILILGGYCVFGGRLVQLLAGPAYLTPARLTRPA